MIGLTLLISLLATAEPKSAEPDLKAALEVLVSGGPKQRREASQTLLANPVAARAIIEPALRDANPQRRAMAQELWSLIKWRLEADFDGAPLADAISNSSRNRCLEDWQPLVEKRPLLAARLLLAIHRDLGGTANEQVDLHPDGDGDDEILQADTAQNRMTAVFELVVAPDRLPLLRRDFGIPALSELSLCAPENHPLRIALSLPTTPERIKKVPSLLIDDDLSLADLEMIWQFQPASQPANPALALLVKLRRERPAALAELKQLSPAAFAEWPTECRCMLAAELLWSPLEMVKGGKVGGAMMELSRLIPTSESDPMIRLFRAYASFTQEGKRMEKITQGDAILIYNPLDTQTEILRDLLFDDPWCRYSRGDFATLSAENLEVLETSDDDIAHQLKLIPAAAATARDHLRDLAIRRAPATELRQAALALASAAPDSALLSTWAARFLPPGDAAVPALLAKAVANCTQAQEIALVDDSIWLHRDRQAAALLMKKAETVEGSTENSAFLIRDPEEDSLGADLLAGCREHTLSPDEIPESVKIPLDRILRSVNGGVPIAETEEMIQKRLLTQLQEVSLSPHYRVYDLNWILLDAACAELQSGRRASAEHYLQIVRRGWNTSSAPFIADFLLHPEVSK